MYCENTHQEGFDTTQVNSIQVNDDDNKESDKDSEGNSMEKMPKKKSKSLYQMTVIIKDLIMIW